MMTILVSSRNAHKIGEIQTLLPEGIRLLTLNDFPGAPQVVEDAPSFSGNAAKKSVELARWLMAGRARQAKEFEILHVLADDSGLEVDALNGAPGIHSARFAALDAEASGNSPDAANNEKLLRLMKDVPEGERTARFRCVIALTELPSAAGDSWPTELFEGTCEGRIAFQPSGGGGFGYDPLFIPNGHEKSFAELGEPIKNQISHRAKALAKLRDYLKTR